MKILKRTNRDSDPNNTVVVAQKESGCCGDDTTICKYTATSAFPITSISYNDGDGEVTITLENAATTVKEFNVELQKIIDKRLADGGLGATDEGGLYYSTLSGSDLSFAAESDIVLTKINAVAVTEECTQVKVSQCKVTLPFETTVELAIDGGTPEDVIVPATGDAAGAKTAVDAAYTALGMVVKSSVVTEDTDNGWYLATVDFVGDCSSLTADGVASTYCSARPDYVA